MTPHIAKASEMFSRKIYIRIETRKPSCRWQTRATRCNVIVAH